MQEFDWDQFEEVKPKNSQSETFDWDQFEEVRPTSQGSTTGWSGIGQDILESLRSAPGSFASALSALPKAGFEAGKQAVTHPVRAGENILAGLLEGVKGAVNIPSNVAEYLASKNIGRFPEVHELTKNLRIGDTGLQKAILGEDQPGDVFLRGLGEFAPYSRVGAATKGLRGIAKRGGAAAAFGAGQQQDPIQSALLSVLGEGAVKGAGALPKLKPSRMISSPLSSDELKEALRITAGTKTSLGDVIENPFLKRQFENKISKFPFSGAPEAMQKTAAKITEKGTDLLDNLLGENTPEFIHEDLVDALKGAKSKVESQKQDKFRKVNQRAEELGLKVGRENFSTVAENELKKLQSNPELLAEADQKLINSLQKYAERSDAQALEGSDIFRGLLGDKASQAFKEGNKHTYGIYKNLRSALDKDIKNAVTKSGDETLKKAHSDAMEFYKQEVVPFEDKDIMSYTNREGDPDLILNKFLKTSRTTDRANLLKKLQDKLPEDKKNLLAYAHFSNALDESGINPSKLNTLYKKLGPKQRKALFPNEKTHQAFKDYSSLVTKNKEPLNLMFNPPTGQKLLENIASLSSLGSGGLAALLSAKLPVVAGAAAAPMVGARLATKYLTSPKSRERLVKKMIKQKDRPIRQMSPDMMSAIRGALEASNQQNIERR